jgi:hypothetical protein
MTPQRLKAAARAAVLLAGVAFGLWSHSTIVMRRDPPVAAPRAEREVALPAGFSAALDVPPTESRMRVVAGDIDRDGDIDVVASVGTLDLIVWKNDGAGHFTRVPSSRRPAFQAQPPPPSFDGETFASSEWIQNDDHHGARLEPLNAIVDASPQSALSTHISLVASQSGQLVRSSRAPPPILPL